MSRIAATAALCLSVGLAWQAAPARAADDPLVGTWETDHDGYREIWTITKDKDDYAVSGVFTRKGNEVGSWKGGDVKVADGKLTCIQKWGKKPDPTWGDDQKLAAQANGDKLTFTWDAGGGNSGTREMTRAKAAAADGSELIGVWKCDHDGFTELLEIRQVKGMWAAGGSFLKNGRVVGAWSGVNPTFADGKLSFTQKYVKKPEASWSDGNTMTAQVANDKLEFTWDNGNGQSGSHEMTKAAK